MAVILEPKKIKSVTTGSMVGLMVNSKRVYAKRAFQCPCPCGEPLPTHTSTGGPPTLAGGFDSVSLGSLLLSSGSWCTQNFVCAPYYWSLCFPQSSGRPIIKSHWPSRPDSLGIHSSFVGSPGWEAWRGVQSLHNSARTSLLLLFSSLWVTHPAGMGFDFIKLRSNCIPTTVSLCLLCCLWTWGIFFLVGSSGLLSMAVQQLVAILVLSQKKMSTHPSTPPSWTRCLWWA